MVSNLKQLYFMKNYYLGMAPNIFYDPHICIFQKIIVAFSASKWYQ